MTNAFNVMAQSVRFGSCAHDEYVSRVLTAVKPAIHHAAIDKPSQTQGESDQADSEENNATGNVFCANEVERSGQQQPRGEANLDTQALFVKETG